MLAPSSPGAWFEDSGITGAILQIQETVAQVRSTPGFAYAEHAILKG